MQTMASFLSALTSPINNFSRGICSGSRAVMPYISKGMDGVIASRLTGAILAARFVIDASGNSSKAQGSLVHKDVILPAVRNAAILACIGTAGGRIPFSADLLKYVTAHAALSMVVGYLTFHTLGLGEDFISRAVELFVASSDASLLDSDASLLDSDASLLDSDASLLDSDASLLDKNKQQPDEPDSVAVQAPLRLVPRSHVRRVLGVGIIGLLVVDGWMRALCPANTLPLAPIFHSLASVGSPYLSRIPGYTALVGRIWQISTQAGNVITRCTSTPMLHIGKVVNASTSSRAIGAFLPILFAASWKSLDSSTSKIYRNFNRQLQSAKIESPLGAKILFSWTVMIASFAVYLLPLHTAGGRIPFSADVLKSVAANTAFSLASGYLVWQTLGVTKTPLWDKEWKLTSRSRFYPRMALGLAILGALGYDGWKRALQPGCSLPLTSLLGSK